METGISTVAFRSMSTDQAGRGEVPWPRACRELVTSLVVAPLMVPMGLLLGYPAEVIALLGSARCTCFSRASSPRSTLLRARRVLVFPALFLALQTAVTGGAGVALISSGGAHRARDRHGARLRGGRCGRVRAREVTMKVPVVLSGAIRKVPSFLGTALPIAATGGIAIVYERVDLMVSKLDSTRRPPSTAWYSRRWRSRRSCPGVIVPAFVRCSRLVSRRLAEAASRSSSSGGCSCC